MSSDEREKEPAGGAEEDDKPDEGTGEERPTVAPPFDPIEFAKGVLASTGSGQHSAPEKMPGSASPSSAPPPSQRVPPKYAVSVPPPAMEGPFSPGALQGPASSSSNPHTRATPPGGFRPPAPTYSDPVALEEARKQSLEMMNRKATPTGALSYVNTTIPSNLPPPPNTKPAGALANEPRRLESVSGLSSVDAEWADLEAATRPPPAGQNPEDFDIPSRREPSGIAHLESLMHGDAGDRTTPTSDPTTPKAPVVSLPLDHEDVSVSDKRTTPPPAPVEDPAFLERAKKKSIREDVPPTEEEMNDRVSLGDYTGALDMAEKLLAADPGNEGIQAVANNCRTVLRQMYITKIGPMDRVPMVMVPRDQLRWLSIDHRAGFVLSLVDGVSSLEMILDVSGMPELDALRILTELAQQRIISFR